MAGAGRGDWAGTPARRAGLARQAAGIRARRAAATSRAAAAGRRTARADAEASRTARAHRAVPGTARAGRAGLAHCRPGCRAAGHPARRAAVSIRRAQARAADRRADRGSAAWAARRLCPAARSPAAQLESSAGAAVSGRRAGPAPSWQNRPAGGTSLYSITSGAPTRPACRSAALGSCRRLPFPRVSTPGREAARQRRGGEDAVRCGTMAYAQTGGRAGIGRGN